MAVLHRALGGCCVSGPSAVQATQSLISRCHRNGDGGCSESGPGVGRRPLVPAPALVPSSRDIPFRTAGLRSEDMAPSAENPLFPAVELKAPLSLPEASVPALPPQSLVFLCPGPWPVHFFLGPPPPSPEAGPWARQAWVLEPRAACSWLHSHPSGWLWAVL